MRPLDVYMLARVAFLDMPEVTIRLHDDQRAPGVLFATATSDTRRASCDFEDLISADYPGGWHPIEVGSRLLELRRHFRPLRRYPPAQPYSDLVALLDRERLDRQMAGILPFIVGNPQPG